MSIAEKVSYLKGLIDGLEIDTSSKEGKVFAAITEVLGEISKTIDEIDCQQDEMAELIDIIDEDLGSLEEDFYELDDDDDDDEDYDYDDDTLFEVKCPSCGEEITLDAEMFEDGEMICPKCSQMLEFDLDDIEELDCGCGCSHSHDGDED